VEVQNPFGCISRRFERDIFTGSYFMDRQHAMSAYVLKALRGRSITTGDDLSRLYIVQIDSHRSSNGIAGETYALMHTSNALCESVQLVAYGHVLELFIVSLWFGLLNLFMVIRYVFPSCRFPWAMGIYRLERSIGIRHRHCRSTTRIAAV
jgi:hypothetical protein